LLLLCAVCAAAVAGWQYYQRGRAVAAPPSVEYVLDASPRMALLSDAGEATRLSVAQSVLVEIIRPSSPTLTAGLRVFGTGKVPSGCADTDLLVPLAPANQSKISTELLAVNTPSKADAAMAAAVIGALRDLAGTTGAHTLVVVTGGSDSCSEQAGLLVAAEAKRDGIDYQLFVIGYQLSAGEGTAVSAFVDQASNGHFVEADSRDQLAAVLRDIQQYAENPSQVSVSAVIATARAAVPTATQTATPTAPPAATSTAAATGTATATSTATATATPTTSLAPKFVAFLARFDPNTFSTIYSVTVTSTATTTAGPAFTYLWTNSNSCGTFTGANTTVATWQHRDIKGGCPVEPVHPATITVSVSNAYGALRCVYAGGSAPGNIVKCQDIAKP
jgi:hypothetical protein